MPDACTAIGEFKKQLDKLLTAAQASGVHIEEIAATLEARATTAPLQRATMAR
jgi:hypothetical protein